MTDIREAINEIQLNPNIQFKCVTPGGDTPTQEKAISITQNGNYSVSADSGKTLSKVTATVDVPNPSTGTLNVSANGSYDVSLKRSAEVNVPNPSTGTLSATQNGTYDVTSYASIDVNVPNPSTGTKEITTNATHTVLNYAYAHVNVPPQFPIITSNLTPNTTDECLWVYTAYTPYSTITSNIISAELPTPTRICTTIIPLNTALPIELAFTESTFIYQNKLYIVGSRDVNSTIPARYIDILDGTFHMRVVNSLRGLIQYASGIYGDNIYLIGGRLSNNSYSSTVTRYNITEDSYTDVSGIALADASHNFGYCTKDNILYIAGGERNAASTEQRWVTAIYAFNMESETLTKVSDMPSGRTRCGCAIQGNYLWIFGGNAGSSGSGTNTIFKMDLDTHVCTEVTEYTLPESTTYHACTVNDPELGRDVIYLSGYSGKYVFDVQTATFTQVTSPVAWSMDYDTVFELNGSLYGVYSAQQLSCIYPSFPLPTGTQFIHTNTNYRPWKACVDADGNGLMYLGVDSAYVSYTDGYSRKVTPRLYNYTAGDWLTLLG